MCNAWDWEASQFPSYGGVSTFKEVGIKKKSRTFKEVGTEKIKKSRAGKSQPGVMENVKASLKRELLGLGRYPVPSYGGVSMGIIRWECGGWGNWGYC